MQWIERNRGHILVLLINLALIGALTVWQHVPSPAPIQLISPLSTPSPTSTPTPGWLRVHVAGAVQRPDVYHLAPGSIVKDALMKAGGPAPDADLSHANLALELHDQQQVYIPRQGEAPVTSGSGAQSPTIGSIASPAAKVNINTATVEELAALPGIGPQLAQRIVDHREQRGPFTDIRQITQVSGIGDKTFERIKDRITVGG